MGTATSNVTCDYRASRGALTPESDGKTVPLTFQQEWALNHWMHEENLYVIGIVLRLRGSLDVHALHTALASVWQRHDALRMRLVCIQGTMRQQVGRSSECSLNVIDLSRTSQVSAEIEAKAIVAEIVRRQADLVETSLVNFTLLRIAECDYVLLCAVHHLILDGISVKILLEEIWDSYGDSVPGAVARRPYVPLQYSDYAIEQRAGHARWLEEHGSYWRSSLAGAVRVQLPHDEGQETVNRFSGAVLTKSFSARLSSEVHALARREHVSAATVMLVVYALLLASWSRQRDFVVPFAVPGRISTKQMRIIGLMGEYLPVRVHLNRDDRITDLFKRITDEFVAGLEHIDFGQIVGESPEFFAGTSLNWFPQYNFASAPAEWSGRSDFPTIDAFQNDLRPREYCNKLTCDVACMLKDTSEGIEATAQYRADVFTSATMERFLEDIKRIAERVVLDPWARVSAFHI